MTKKRKKKIEPTKTITLNLVPKRVQDFLKKINLPISYSYSDGKRLFVELELDKLEKVDVDSLSKSISLDRLKKIKHPMVVLAALEVMIAWYCLLCSKWNLCSNCDLYKVWICLTRSKKVEPLSITKVFLREI